MNIAELIQALQKLDPHLPVMVRGYENGVNDVMELRQIRIKKSENTRWFDGLYEFADDNSGTPAIELWGDNLEGEKD